MATRPTSISVKTLSDAVAKAVADIGDHGKGITSQFTMDHLIWGRVLRDAMTLDQAQGLAKDITAKVQATKGLGLSGAGAVHLEPAVLAAHGHITIGFIADRQIALHE